MNRDAFDKGLKTRREVLGAEYVDQSIQNADGSLIAGANFCN